MERSFARKAPAIFVCSSCFASFSLPLFYLGSYEENRFSKPLRSRGTGMKDTEEGWVGTSNSDRSSATCIEVRSRHSGSDSSFAFRRGSLGNTHLSSFPWTSRRWRGSPFRSRCSLFTVRSFFCFPPSSYASAMLCFLRFRFLQVENYSLKFAKGILTKKYFAIVQFHFLRRTRHLERLPSRFSFCPVLDLSGGRPSSRLGTLETATTL